MNKLFSTFAVSCCILQLNASAQMTGGSVFLKGQYVEAGICNNGDFGAASAPAGYHPHAVSTGGGALGFVADPAMDGWTTGSPAYAGDFFTPGFPFEGWNLQIDTVRAQAQSCMGFTGSGLTGSNISYTTIGSKRKTTWEGTFDSMTVRQETTLDTMALYFTMKVTLINNASVAKNNVYYLRSLDPDNDQSWGGSFSTTNKIEHQLPNALNATVVSATGITHPSAYLALGTADTNAKCLIYGAWPISSATDLATVHSGGMSGGHYTAGYTGLGDLALGLTFRVAHMAPVDSASDSVAYKTTTTPYPHLHPANEASFSYFYAFSPDAVDSALAYLSDTTGWVGDTASGTDTSTTTLVGNINGGGNIVVFPNPAYESIHVSGLSSTDYLALYDMMGREQRVEWNTGSSTFSLAGISTGNYILTIKDERGVSRARIPLRKQ